MFAFIASWIAFMLALIVVGFVAGFSPTLYMTQIAVMTRSKQPVYQSMILLAGVGSSLLLLTGIFFILRPEKLQLTGVTDILLERLLDGVAGVLCIVVGAVLILRTRTVSRRTGSEGKVPAHLARGSVTLFSLGFIRGITRVSGVAALFLGVRMTIGTEDILLYQLVSLAVLLSAAMLPFLVLLYTKLRMPRIFRRMQRASDVVFSIDYRRYTGPVLVIIGCILLTLHIL